MHAAWLCPLFLNWTEAEVGFVTRSVFPILKVVCKVVQLFVLKVSKVLGVIPIAHIHYGMVHINLNLSLRSEWLGQWRYLFLLRCHHSLTLFRPSLSASRNHEKQRNKSQWEECSLYDVRVVMNYGCCELGKTHCRYLLEGTANLLMFYRLQNEYTRNTVSYTHLTLPTKLSV